MSACPLVVLACESLHVCTVCIWRCEHARFCVEGFYALYINFHSFIHTTTTTTTTTTTSASAAAAASVLVRVALLMLHVRRGLTGVGSTALQICLGGGARAGTSTVVGCGGVAGPPPLSHRHSARHRTRPPGTPRAPAAVN